MVGVDEMKTKQTCNDKTIKVNLKTNNTKAKYIEFAKTTRRNLYVESKLSNYMKNICCIILAKK
jgi:hypothetical protein